MELDFVKRSSKKGMQKFKYKFESGIFTVNNSICKIMLFH